MIKEFESIKQGLVEAIKPSPNSGERVASVGFSDEFLIVGLTDERRISVPLEWYPRLAGASDDARSNWEICGGGYGLHWPELDEDLSTEGLLRGAPAPDA